MGTVRRRVTHETQRRLIRLAKKTDERLLVAFTFGHFFGEDIRTHTMTPSTAVLALNDQFVGQIFMCAQRAGRQRIAVATFGVVVLPLAIVARCCRATFQTTDAPREREDPLLFGAIAFCRAERYH